MKSETQIKIARITALVLFLIPLLAIFVLLIGGLLSTCPLLPQPNFLHHLSGGFGIGFTVGCLPALIILYCFLSALSEIKFTKGLVSFLLYCGLAICTNVFLTSGIWSWFLQIVVFLLLFQGVTGLYKAKKVKRDEKFEPSAEIESQKDNEPKDDQKQ